MIKVEEFRQIDTNIDEGKLLLAAISILTSIDSEQIKRKRWGGMISPDQAHDQIVELANRIFFEEEYKQIEFQNKRNKIIEGIIDNV